MKLAKVKDPELVEEVIKSSRFKLGDPNAELTIIVFFDLKCPHCGRMFREVDRYLVELAKEGRAQVVFCDYLVHDDARPLHLFLRCFDRMDDVLNFMDKIYAGLIKMVVPCKDVSDDIDVLNELGERLRVLGTPTVIVYDKVRRAGVVRFGSMSLGDLKRLVESVRGGEVNALVGS